MIKKIYKPKLTKIFLTFNGISEYRTKIREAYCINCPKLSHLSTFVGATLFEKIITKTPNLRCLNITADALDPECSSFLQTSDQNLLEKVETMMSFQPKSHISTFSQMG